MSKSQKTNVLNLENVDCDTKSGQQQIFKKDKSDNKKEGIFSDSDSKNLKPLNQIEKIVFEFNFNKQFGTLEERALEVGSMLRKLVEYHSKHNSNNKMYKYFHKNYIENHYNEKILDMVTNGLYHDVSKKTYYYGVLRKILFLCGVSNENEIISYISDIDNFTKKYDFDGKIKKSFVSKMLDFLSNNYIRICIIIISFSAAVITGMLIGINE